MGLLADAEAGEHAVEYVFGVDAAGDAVERAAREADVFGGQFEIVFQNQGPLQALQGLSQQFAVTQPGGGWQLGPG